MQFEDALEQICRVAIDMAGLMRINMDLRIEQFRRDLHNKGYKVFWRGQEVVIVLPDGTRLGFPAVHGFFDIVEHCFTLMSRHLKDKND